MSEAGPIPNGLRWQLGAFVIIVLGALALRYPQLALRPMHNDEAVNAVNFTRPLWERGAYRYDPNEYHGPTLHFAALPFLWLSPAHTFSQVTEKTLRLVPLFFGVALIGLLWWLRDGLGDAAMLWAGFLAALSPGMVFYSRYYIHEMLLVCFTMLVLVAGWRYLQRPQLTWAVVGGAGLGLMHSTKETFVIPVACMAIAALLVGLWQRRQQGAPPQNVDGRSGRPTLGHGLAALCAWFAVSFVLFTDFFTHRSSWLDSFRSYLPWLHRAGGHSPHIHAFGFYLGRLAFYHQSGGAFWSEGLILGLALLGALAALSGHGLSNTNVWFARFLAFYTVPLTLAYSLISYKTPWCMLGFLHGMILLAGIGAATLLRFFESRPVQAFVGIFLVAGAAQLGWQAWRSDFYEGDPRDPNPYAYAQTVPDLLDLVEKLETLARFHPDEHQMLIKVMVPDSDYWPLPWYLRRFQRVGWWDHIPDNPSAPVMIVGSKLSAALDDRPNKTWSALGLYGLRRETVLQLCVEPELWRRYVQAAAKK